MLKETKEFIETFEPKLPSKATKTFAHIVSFVFHPVFMPTILAYGMYYFVRASFAGIELHDFVLKMLIPIFACTAFFPIFAVLLMKALGFVEDIHLYKPRDRFIPLIVCMVFYFSTYYWMMRGKAPILIQVLMLGSYCNIVALFIINIFFRISMHTTGAGGMLGMLIVLLLVSPVSLTIPFFLGIFIAGFIGTARLLLKAHKPSEIWWGYLLGIVVQLAAYVYLSE
jgi:hypothetical protein